MSSAFFRYDELTWPEIAGLERDTPLVIPLGEKHGSTDLANKLGDPERIGLLPAIPFGWKGSGLEVPGRIFCELINHLVENLKEDGFSNVSVLVPENTPLKIETNVITKPVEDPANLGLTRSDHGRVVLLPIGHTEQHALHLPLSVDTLSVEAVMQGTARAIPEKTACLPVFPYGVSTHRRHFAGTMNVGGRTFEDFWLSIIDVLMKMGYEMVYLNSGHGGNVSFLVNVVKYAGESYPHAFCATTWLYLNGPKSSEIIAKHRQSRIGGLGHACELETSFTLALRPDLVHMDRVVDEIEFISTPSYYQDWLEGGTLIANPPWTDDTQTGAYGAGSLGTVEKGRIWLQAAIEEKIENVNEIIEQQKRRKAKRFSLKY